MADKVVNLQEYLLNRKVDISQFKPDITEDADSLSAAATAWTSSEKGIRAVIEHRMQKVREEMIFTCQPYETSIKRDILAELATLIEDFEMCAAESKKRAEQREETNDEEMAAEAEPQPLATIEEESEDDNSSM